MASRQDDYWRWDERRQDYYHPHYNPSTGEYEYIFARDSRTPRTGVLPTGTTPVYPAGPGRSPPSQPAPQLPPQPREGFAYGAPAPSSQSYVHSAPPARPNVEGLSRDFAQLGTSGGHANFSQTLPRPSTSFGASYGVPSGYPAESSRAAGKRPATDYVAMARTSAGLPHPDLSMPYGTSPGTTTSAASQGPSSSVTIPSGSYPRTDTMYPATQPSAPKYSGRLDPREFFVRNNPHKFFVEGKVFIKLHTEDAGTTAPDRNSAGFTVVSYGEMAYSQLRRFVVVKAKPKEHYCLCVPILTYSGKGAGKKGVDQKSHAIIYTGSHAPDKLATEAAMNKQPIRVLPSRADEKLDPISRVNMGKLFTIEWNTKVKDIGQVEKSSLVRLLGYWRQIVNT